GTSIAAAALPRASATIGIKFCAAKPPKLPSVEIAPIPAAARSPDRKREGSDQKQGRSSEIQGVPTIMATSRIQFSGTTVLRKKAVTPMQARPAMATTTDL